jgi:hypothetical protein
MFQIIWKYFCGFTQYIFSQWRNERQVKARKEKNNLLFFHLAGV